MKKINIKKKHAVAGSGATLLLLAGIVAVALILSSMSQMHEEISTLNSRVKEQAKQITVNQTDIKSINAQNGTALQVCLENASKDYSNALKSKATVDPKPDGTTTYTYDMDSYNKINDELNDDRSKCNSQYK